MNVIYHNRNQLSVEVESQAAKGGMQYIKTLDELLQRSDVVSLHCRLRLPQRASSAQNNSSP